MAGADIRDPDDLYALDPSEFTAARNALVKGLRSDGRRDEASAVAELRRPSAAAWALNQVAREEQDLVTLALEAGAALREATEAAVGGDAAELRSATAGEHAASDAAIDAALSRLGSRGPALRQQVAATLRAAVLDDHIADELRRGVLTTDHEASGFDFATGFAVGKIPEAARSSRPPKPPKAKRKPSKEEAAGEDEERELRKRRAALERRVRDLQKRADRLAGEADQREAEARTARADADAVALELEDAERELSELGQ